jgi:selenocysteine-specific elongation factor
VRVLDPTPAALGRRGDALRRARVLAGDPPPAPEVDDEPVPPAPDEPDLALDEVLDRLHQHFAGSPFEAPDVPTLAEIGLDDATAARLHREGRLLRPAPGVVLLPGADERALEVLAGLEAPFTTSAARQALGTSRRVALALLGYLDRSGRTVRLPDDRRRLRG